MLNIIIYKVVIEQFEGLVPVVPETEFLTPQKQAANIFQSSDDTIDLAAM